jgi:hypothetical protein
MIPMRGAASTPQCCSRTLSVVGGDTDLCQRRLKTWCLQASTATDRKDHMDKKQFPLLGCALKDILYVF